MANVLFKKGLQNNVPITSGAVDGTFYLTTDTRRLYVGTEGGKAVPLCETVQIVANVASLPKTDDIIKGNFYYATEENILCIHNGTDWVQINPDTNTKNSSLTQTISAASNVASITTTVKDSENKTVEDIIKIAVSNGLTLSGSGDTVTIQGTTYTISGTVQSASEATIALDNNGGSVKFKGKGVSFSSTADNEITITADENTDTKYDLTGGNGSNGKGFQVNLVEVDGGTDSVKLDPIIQTKNLDGTANTSTAVEFENGVAVIDAYSTSAIEQLMNGLNAMTYRGTVGSDGTTDTLPSTGVQAGDTYLINNGSSSFQVAGSAYAQTGDIVIATGTEKNGVLESVTWEIVPAGNEIDTLVELQKTTSGFQLKETNGNNATKGSVAFSGDDYINVAIGGSGKDTTIAVSHKNVTCTPTTGTAVTQTPEETVTLTVVDGVTVDTKGHITGYSTKQYSLKDTDTKVSSFDVSATATNNVATIGYNLGLTNGIGGSASSKTDSYTITSKNENLTISTSGTAGTNLDIDFVWGTF